MSLRNSLNLIPETIQEFELASADKFAEGQQLVASGSLSGGIYLLGYVAEMLLKNACDLYLGAKPGDFIGATVNTLTSAPWKSQYTPMISVESKHSLKFWASMLQNLRDDGGDRFSASFRFEFNTRTTALYDTWWVEMRYRSDRAALSDAISMLDNVGWIRNNYPLLWTV